MHLKLWLLLLRALHLYWHLQPIHLWGSEELVRLREAGPNIDSSRLFMEWRLPLAILLHFLDFVFNHNGFIDHVLEIDVVNVEQLELTVTIQPI
jgi:hypothetical protein